MQHSSTFNATDGDGYELTMGRWSRRLASPFLAFAGGEDARQVLDVGCGTGALSAEILRLRPFAQVQAIDLAEVYTEHARRRHPDPRVSFTVGDACAMNFPDAQFDLVASLLVLHFVPEPGRAIAEMRRVARPGATVAAAVWDARGGFVANRLFLDTAAALDPRAAQRRAVNYTRPMTRPGELGAAWHAAGFAQVDEAQLLIRMTFADFEDYWRPYLGKDGPGAAYVSQLDAQEVSRLEEAVRAAYLDGEADGPRSYAAVAWAVKGTA